MEATQTKQRTHCSVCGQKIVRPDMPYCIYCGNHFELMEAEGEGEKRKETRNMARLAKMPEHADHAAAMEATPSEGPEFDRWNRSARAGAVLAALGAALVVLHFLAGWAVPVAPVLGAALVLVGGWRFVGNAGKKRARLAMPMMKRAAIVTDRRSETELRFNTGVTTYFFKFEFADGAEAEFRYPGRGAHHEPLSRGITGIAYTRGPELIDFKQIRV
jgi:hypothetical protein